jgi:hypothetical protein
MKIMFIIAITISSFSTSVFAGRPIAIGDDDTGNPGAVVFGVCRVPRC